VKTRPGFDIKVNQPDLILW